MISYFLANLPTVAMDFCFRNISLYIELPTPNFSDVGKSRMLFKNLVAKQVTSEVIS
jgi:hypothetical protein